MSTSEDKDSRTVAGEHVAPVASGTVHVLPPAPDAAIDPQAERRLLAKLDLIIYPPFFVMYTMSFLDRINIGNARIQGMTEDLDLHGNRFNVALLVYFIPYIVLEIPSNMLIRKMRPSLHLSSLMFVWGVVNMCMGFVRSYAALVALRLLLGVFEAGVLPGIIYVTSTYYRRHEYQKRLSLFFCSTVVAGAFGGLLAYAITRLGGARGLAAWRWIFIVEGAATSGLALVAALVTVDWPEQTRWLDAAEKELLRRRLTADVGDTCRMDTLTGFALRLIASDYKIWLCSLAFLGVGVAGYSGAFFLPSILVEFEWRAEEAQVQTIPVYVFAGGVMLLGAWASDRLKHRLGFILAGASMTLTGYGMLLAQTGKSRDYKFAAVFLVFGGSYTATPLTLGWLQNNLSGHWKRSFGSAAQVTLGNLGGIIGSLIFVDGDRPRYALGYGVAAAMMAMGAGSALAVFALMWRENKKRAAGERDHRLRLPREVRENLGDWHPSFRFTL